MSVTWTPWNGGECPVGYDAEVLIQREDGRYDQCKAGELFWAPCGKPYSITAFCVIAPYVARPWRAEEGQEFWYVTTGGKSKRWTERFDEFCDRAYEAGNYYQTKELSDQASVRVRAAYKGDTP